MRQPSHDSWHSDALVWLTTHDSLRGFPGGLHEGDPHPGWFKRRLVSRGPWIPASITLEAPFDPETGELLGPEEFACEVMGEPRDVMEEWTWLAGSPISRETYTTMLEILFTGEFA
jgi:hypothetical protein